MNEKGCQRHGAQWHLSLKGGKSEATRKRTPTAHRTCYGAPGDRPTPDTIDEDRSGRFDTRCFVSCCPASAAIGRKENPDR
jgi:hypothetical protein